MRRQWPVHGGAGDLLDAALAQGQVSPRGLDRVLKLSWTLADLAERDRPTADDVAAALDLRLAGSQPLTGSRFLRRPA